MIESRICLNRDLTNDGQRTIRPAVLVDPVPVLGKTREIVIVAGAEPVLADPKLVPHARVRGPRKRGKGEHRARDMHFKGASAHRTTGTQIRRARGGKLAFRLESFVFDSNSFLSLDR